MEDEQTLVEGGELEIRVPTLRLVVEHQDRAHEEFPLGLAPVLLGKGEDCDVVLKDPRVSRRHCELRLVKGRVLLRDLESTNGSLIGDVPVKDAVLLPGHIATIGSTRFSVRDMGSASTIALSASTAFGAAMGASVAMRAIFEQLRRAAKMDDTVLLLGESGTGKELLAHGTHQVSHRSEGPMVVFDCSACNPSLVEAELFGHARGAFTGAVGEREGVFQQANGGTLFLDEVGELPLEVQPKLLRALEARQVRPLGSNAWQQVDVRVIAATHRDLRSAVREGTFRQDLYYRLAVLQVRVPALRERKEDIPMLVEAFLSRRQPPQRLTDLPAGSMQLLTAHAWPGNVRELRNAVARLATYPEMSATMLLDEAPGADGDAWERVLDLPLREAREAVVTEFEIKYLRAHLERAGGSVADAAVGMGVSRQFLYRLLDSRGLGRA